LGDQRQQDLNGLDVDKRSVLAAHDFFSALPPPVIGRLATRTRLATYPAGTEIISKGDEGLSLFGLTKGLARVSSISEDGKEIYLNLLRAPEIFGEVALLDGGHRTATVTAVTDCQLIVLDRRDFVSLLMEEPIIGVKLLEAMAARFRRLSEQIEDFSFANPSRRLAKTLLWLAAKQDRDGDHRHVAITQRELGQAVSLSRESTNRQLREWVEAGYITLEKGGCTIVDMDALRNIAKAGQDQ
jgi:CRP-like cAMP-binding protein